jgi:hypothetical protein
MNWLKQAVTASDNTTYEGAYLALAAIIALTALTILAMLLLAGVEIALCNRTLPKECFNPAGLGGGIAAAIAAVGAFLAGVGSYIWLDRKGTAAPVPATTTTTEEKSTIVKTVAAAPAAPADELLAAGRGVERLSPKIGKEDVGKSVAMVKPKRRRRAS